MPSKASLPSALVDPTDMPPQPHSMDSVGRQSKQSSSRSGKPSSNSSKDDGVTSTRSFLKPFKNFKKDVVQGENLFQKKKKEKKKSFELPLYE